VLEDALKARGALVDVLPVYRNVVPEGLEEAAKALFSGQSKPDWVTLMSPSAVKNLLAAVGLEALRRVKIATIGPVTSAAARRMGWWCRLRPPMQRGCAWAGDGERQMKWTSTWMSKRRVRVVIVGEAGARIWGNSFSGGEERSRKRVLIFDDSASFHKDIGLAYGIEVTGGGWVEFDQTNRTARVGGRSTQFGRESDRGLTVDLLDEALPDYRVEAV